MIGCDMLRRHSAVIDMCSGKITLDNEQGEWSNEIIGRTCAPHNRQSFTTLLRNYREEVMTAVEESACTEDDIRNRKLEEIQSFQPNSNSEITHKQKGQIISIYNRYRRIFSDLPGKAKNFVCQLSFNSPINFNKKLYPIAQSLKPAVKKGIRRLMDQDIIEYSSSLYTSPIVAIQKKDGAVRLCLDARKIN